MRVGPRFKFMPPPVQVNLCCISWVQEINYLGVHFHSGNRLTCNWSLSRRNCFSSLNNIVDTVGSYPNISVTLALFKQICIPILTYGISAFSLSKTEISKFSYAYNNIFHKLFKTNDSKIIAWCQFYCGIWSMSTLYDYIRMTFIKSMMKQDCFIANGASFSSDYDDVCAIMNRYNIARNDSPHTMKCKIDNFILLTASSINV